MRATCRMVASCSAVNAIAGADEKPDGDNPLVVGVGRDKATGSVIDFVPADRTNQLAWRSKTTEADHQESCARNSGLGTEDTRAQLATELM